MKTNDLQFLKLSPSVILVYYSKSSIIGRKEFSFFFSIRGQLL